MRQKTNGVTSDFTRGVILAIAKPPFTVEQLKKVLGALRYYELSMQGCLDCMKKNSDSSFLKIHLQTIKNRRENVLKLFDYCATDFDRDILQRRFFYNEEYFDIAYDIGYSERATYKHLKKALERLSENTKNM